MTKPPSNFLAGLNDIYHSFRMIKIWFPLGLADFLQAYHLAWLGPLWTLLQPAIWVVAVAVVFLPFMNMDLPSYVAHVAVGLVLFTHISGSINDSGAIFIKHKNLIANLNLPLFFYILKDNAKVVLRSGLPFLVIFCLALYLGPEARFFSALIGLVVLLLFTLGLSAFVAVMVTAFGDLAFAIGAVLRLMFFVTPIVWSADDVTGLRRLIVDFNPFYYFLEIVRMPLLGRDVPEVVMIVALCLTMCSLLFGGVSFILARKKIPYWVA